MTEDQQSIAIAKALGWKQLDWTRMVGLPPDGITGTALGYNVPDYPNDLNAMFDAEVLLIDEPEKWNEYVRKVHWIVSEWVNANFDLREQMVGLAIHATAHQRAEAFLRTLGLWREEA